MNRDYRDRVRIMARRQELERDPARAAAAIIITVARDRHTGSLSVDSDCS